MDEQSILSQWLNSRADEDKPLRLPEGERPGLSPAQSRLFFLSQLHPHSPVYNYAEVIELHGPIDTALLQLSLEQVVNKQQILKSAFTIDDDGHLFSRILDELIFDVKSPIHVEQEKLEEFLISESGSAFDLLSGPLTRFNLVRLRENHHVLLVTTHHIISDKWSMRIFQSDLAKAYQGLLAGELGELKPLSYQYSDVAYHSRNKTIADEHWNYWLSKLTPLPVTLELPVDGGSMDAEQYAGGWIQASIEDDTFNRIKSIVDKEKVTNFTFLLAAFKCLLYRYSGSTDLTVGSPFTTRTEQEWEDIIGFFNESLPIRSEFSGEFSFNDLLSEVHENVQQAFQHKDIHYDELIQRLNPKRSLDEQPLFRTMFLYHETPERLKLTSSTEMTSRVLDIAVSKFDLSLYTEINDNSLAVILEYSSELFTKQRAKSILEDYCHLLSLLTEHIDKPLAQIPLNSELINNRSLAGPVEDYEAQTLVDLIDVQIKNNPDGLAVEFENQKLTYKQLDALAKNVAISINNNRPENNIVALHIHRSVDLIVGIYGILKAGCAYLPIDPNYPSNRTLDIIEDANCQLVISDSSLSIPKVQVLDVSAIQVASAQEQQRFEQKINPNHLAYVIYTSGSSGKPKGVKISHKNIVYSTLARTSFYNHSPDKFLLQSSYSFDSSMVGIFWTLTSGGCVLIAPNRIEQDIEKWTIYINDKQVSHTLMLPSLYNQLLTYGNKENLTSLKTVIVAGEPCDSNTVSNHFTALKNCKLYNEYGPTEASVWCIAHEVKPTESIVPIGKPIANVQIFLLDESLKEVPFGSTGELYVAGPTLAQGYLGQEELTTERFITWQHNDQSLRLYKTGDLGSLNKDGQILFLGREDDQVKIRGHRVELSDINTHIQSTEGVNKVSTIYSKVNGLISFYEGDTDIEHKIRERLALKLPSYMMVKQLIHIAETPQLPNGKTDYKALQKLVQQTSTVQIQDADLNTNQRELMVIWKNVLGTDSISLDSNFFDIGGDSIKSIQIIALARKKGISIQAHHIFEHQSLRELAEVSEKVETTTSMQNSDPSHPFPMLPMHNWFFANFHNKPEHWNLAYRLRFKRKMTPTKTVALIKTILEKHASLRLQFDRVNKSVDLLEVDIENVHSFCTAAEAESTLKQIHEGFSFDSPLFHFLLIGDSEQIDQLHIICHHLLVDMVSFQIILDDIKEFIELGRISTTSSLDISHYANAAKTHTQSTVPQEHSLMEEGENSSDLNDLTENNAQSIDHVINIDMAESKLLATAKKLNCQNQDILISALVNTMTNQLNKEKISIQLEHHGRSIPNMDFSSTVGWFTHLYNVEFSSRNDLGEQIKEVSSELQNVQRHGLAYKGNRAMNSLHKPLINFNYLGKIYPSENDAFDSEFVISETLRHTSSERQCPLDVVLSFEEKTLVSRWTYDANYMSTEQIGRIIKQYESDIKKIVQFSDRLSDNITSDSPFPESGLDVDDLNDLLTTLTD